MYTVSDRGRKVLEYVERQLLEVMQNMQKHSTYEEEQKQKEWNEHWLREWSKTPEQKYRQQMDNVLSYIGVNVDNVRRIK